MDRHGATACRLPNLASSEARMEVSGVAREPPLKRARPVSGSLRAVLFDFDATLTVREERGRRSRAGGSSPPGAASSAVRKPTSPGSGAAASGVPSVWPSYGRVCRACTA
ncbi:unnamed protein product [Effrenium voratum]|uniref:Uncharacterized protein n=1 Tax=Effrenium voratum TaxID=2562239 RepID=A0AA36MUR4_9DINO|nr:unnamed protein product [Effrenium voratum]